MQPAGLAVGVVLVLPDRYALLYFIDDVAAGREGRFAMTRAHADPHRQLADRERADAVRAAYLDDVEAPHRLAEDAIAFGLREFRVSLVVEAMHRAAGVAVAHPAFERRARA